MRGSLVAAAACAALAAACGEPPPAPEAEAPARAPAEVAALPEILADDDLLVRSARLAALLAALAPEQLEPARAAFEAARLGRAEVDLVLFATWWARFDPEAAYLWTRTHWKTDHPRVQLEVFRTWGARDPDAALQTATRHPVPDVRAAFVQAVLAGWAASDEPGLVAYVQGLAPGREQQQAIGVLAEQRVLAVGADEALRWAGSVPGGSDEFKLNLHRRIASAVAEIEPAKAAAWAETQLDGPYARGLPRRVATRWVRSDPEAAMRWLSTLPAGENREDGVEEAYRDWLVRDREAARSWMREAEPAPWLEPALSIYARSLSTEDPAEALAVAERIEDETLRHYTVTVIARYWLQQEPEAAERWIEQAGLPEDVRRRIRTFPDARPGRFPQRQRAEEEES